MDPARTGRKRIVEVIAEASNQSGGAQVNADTQRYEALLITLQAFGGAGSALVVAPSPYASSYTLNDGSPLVPPAASGTTFFGLGLGTMIGVPVPNQLIVAMTVAGGQASITVEGVRYEEVPEVNEHLERTYDTIERIAALLAVLVDVMRKRR